MPTWTTPPNFTAGVVATEAELDALSADLNMAAGVTKPAVAVQRAAAQSIPNNVFTAISFDTEVYDTDTMFAATSTNITVKTAGLWLITAAAGLNAAASSRRALQLAVNGAGVVQSEGAATAAAIRLNTAVQLRLAVNDIVTSLLYQNSGGAVNTLTSASGSADPAQLQMTWLGA